MDIAMLQTLFPLLHAAFPLKVDYKSRQLDEFRKKIILKILGKGADNQNGNLRWHLP